VGMSGWRVCLAASAAVPGLLCPGCAGSARARPADLDGLAGGQWAGTLTYLDYSTKKSTSIPCTLEVARAGGGAWEVRTGYPDEPHANSRERVALGEDGRRLGDEAVVERRALEDGGVLLVTERDGVDDDRPARFRFEYRIGAHEYSLRKLVRLNGEREFFERHIYRWSRP